ncbi:MAG TPA: nucleotide exchange factor GrpE [Anaeromyxobacteraceae bacterium]|jgi:molecular chaperone GrpE
MGQDNGKGSFSADIPQSVLDEALEAVEKREGDGGEGAAPAAPPEGLAAEVERLRAELELSQQKGRESYEKLKEEHDLRLRAVADLDNQRKRAAREREETQKFANERLLKDILPVVDNLDRALAAAPDGSPLSGGVKLVLKVLEEGLARNGVQSFHALGQQFDPRLHEAIMTVPTAEHPPGTVVLEHGRGFRLYDRLVRPALVAVAAPPPSGGGPAGGAGTEEVG